MRLTYTWTEQEWKEAMSVAAQATQRRGLPAMTWALLGIPLVGSLGELGTALRRGHGIYLKGSTMPMLLLLAALAGGLLIAAALLRQRRHTRSVMPAGEQEAVLQEDGWRFRTRSRFRRQNATLRPWPELTGVRQGSTVVVLLRADGFDALPTRTLSPEQGGHMHRMLMRKLRPVV